VYRALIVCNSRFPAASGSLSDLYGPQRDGYLLRDALTDHGTGMFDGRDVQNVSEGLFAATLSAIDDFFSIAEPDDTLLFYYSGHGFTMNQQLFLCVQDTKVDRLPSTALSGDALNLIVANSLAQVKILILDCCYAAMLKGSDITEELSGTGRYVIAATSASERARDAALKGLPSPFTQALAEALLSKAEDRNGNGGVNLDDVYSYLETVKFHGSRPHRKFDGGGTIKIARRPPRQAKSDPRDAVPGDGEIAEGALPRAGRAGFHGLGFGQSHLPYLDRTVPGASFSPARVGEFRERMHSEVLETIPDHLSPQEFLERAGLMRHGDLTYAGVLLFGDNPRAFLPAAMVQCARFNGTTRTAPMQSASLRGTVPELIVEARDFIAKVARVGEVPTTGGAYAEPAYRYPMIAVREIIANAVVHRDYENQESCVQIHAFDDRVEVLSPGKWGGTPTVVVGEHPLGQLERTSQRRNFRLADTLSWLRLVEGVGAGVPRSIEDCGATGAPEPVVVADEQLVKVTIFPRPLSRKPDNAGRRRTVIWGSEIPFRNPTFTGRAEELAALRAQVTDDSPTVIRQPLSALYGLGGVGKTELAAEYAHRYSGDYDVVWWIRADQEAAIQASLIALGQRLGLTDISGESGDHSVRGVLEALQSGDPYEHWLLIFDDATQPSIISRYIPQGSGHVIITSRISEWRRELRTEGIEVKEFPLAEAVQFLRIRVPQLGYRIDGSDGARDLPESEDNDREQQAEHLARTLGGLPLAVEHAASYLAQTGIPAAEYIADFEHNANELLGRDADMFTSKPVSTSWRLSSHTVTPEAKELFELLAFFSAEPVSEELLIQSGRVADLTARIQKVLTSRIELRRAERQLARFSLVKIDGARDVVQLHPVVQAVTRSHIASEDPGTARMLRDAVHALLAASDPGDPEKQENDPLYERSVHHLLPSGALESNNLALRDLIINQVRRLHLRERFSEAISLGEQALAAWQQRNSPADIQTLALATVVGEAMRPIGRVEEAFALNARTLDLLHKHHGDRDETYLICAASHGEDLRLLGRYDEALALELSLLSPFEETFSPSQHRLLNLRHNMAIDLRCVGQYERAFECDTENAAELERYFGAADRQTICSRLGLASDLRRLGRYEDALVLARELTRVVEARQEPWRFLRLEAYSGLSVALRRAGYHDEARAVAEDVYQRYRALAGDEHRTTLVAATNLMCALRIADDLAAAHELGERTVLSWEKIAGADHPNTLATRANLAAVLRMRGNPAAARETNVTVLAGFRKLYAYDHPSILLVMTNLASDLAAVGAVGDARDLGEQTLGISRRVRGAAHPATLAVAANLALDLRATGFEAAASDLRKETLTAYEAELSLEHPQALRASQNHRVTVDIVPASP
jgi:hypothetical protein